MLSNESAQWVKFSPCYKQPKYDTDLLGLVGNAYILRHIVIPHPDNLLVSFLADGVETDIRQLKYWALPPDPPSEIVSDHIKKVYMEQGKFDTLMHLISTFDNPHDPPICLKLAMGYEDDGCPLDCEKCICDVFTKLNTGGNK